MATWGWRPRRRFPPRRPCSTGRGDDGDACAAGEPGMTPPVPNPGVFEGRTHLLPVRVYYEDTDFSGVVYHANYLRYLERGRSDFLRLAGISHTELRTLDQPIAF